MTTSNDELISLIYNGEPEALIPPAYRAALPVLLKQHPEVKDSFHYLLSRKSNLGSESVRECLQEALTEMSDIMSHTVDPDYWFLQYNDGDVRLGERLYQSWAVGSVRGDLGAHPSLAAPDTHVLYQINLMLRLLYDADRKLMRKGDTDYWRGATVLYSVYARGAFNFATLDEQKDAIGFIEWAGQQQNIARIVAIASERSSLNVNTIESVLSQSQVAPALGNGAL